MEEAAETEDEVTRVTKAKETSVSECYGGMKGQKLGHCREIEVWVAAFIQLGCPHMGLHERLPTTASILSIPALAATKRQGNLLCNFKSTLLENADTSGTSSTLYHPFLHNSLIPLSHDPLCRQVVW